MAKAHSNKAANRSSGPARTAGLHSRVIYELYNMETAKEYTRSVSFGQDTMTIEIPAQPGTQHCLVKGTKQGHLFHGHNTSRELDPVDVEATWCDMGDGYLCLWIEEGTEYIVRFSAPR